MGGAVQKIVDALANEDVGAAIAYALDAEWAAFQSGSKTAGEFGFVRHRLEQGDVPNALAVLRQLERRRR